MFILVKADYKKTKVVLQVTIDRKYQVLFNLKGQGVDKDPKGVLRIEEATGRILVYGPVDFEEYQVLKVSFLQTLHKTSRTANDFCISAGVRIRTSGAVIHELFSFSLIPICYIFCRINVFLF